jgi:hypothetical protein
MNELIKDVITPYFDKVISKLSLLETRINTIEKKCDSLQLSLIDLNNKCNKCLNENNICCNSNCNHTNYNDNNY